MVHSALSRAHVHHVLLCRARRRVIDHLLPQVAVISVRLSLLHPHLQQHLLLGQILLLGWGLGLRLLWRGTAAHTCMALLSCHLLLVQLVLLDLLHQEYLLLFCKLLLLTVLGISYHLLLCSLIVLTEQICLVRVGSRLCCIGLALVLT